MFDNAARLVTAGSGSAFLREKSYPRVGFSPFSSLAWEKIPPIAITRQTRDNGDAHIKNLLLHHKVILPITNGRIDFGRGPRLFYCEFDGQLTKRVIIKAIGE